MKPTRSLSGKPSNGLIREGGGRGRSRDSTRAVQLMKFRGEEFRVKYMYLGQVIHTLSEYCVFPVLITSATLPRPTLPKLLDVSKLSSHPQAS